MARTKVYRLSRQEPERLRVTIDGATVQVMLDGNDAATMKGFAAMNRGWSTTLADGRHLEIRTLRPVLLPELSILVNGRHIDDSPSHPAKMLRGSAQALLIGAVIFVVMAVPGWRQSGWYSIALELLQIAGAALLFRRMYVGLILVVFALAADVAVTTLMTAIAPSPSLFLILATRLMFGLFLFRAYLALRDVRSYDQNPVVP
jgi:hypothetical protein